MRLCESSFIRSVQPPVGCLEACFPSTQEQCPVAAVASGTPHRSPGWVCVSPVTSPSLSVGSFIVASVCLICVWSFYFFLLPHPAHTSLRTHVGDRLESPCFLISFGAFVFVSHAAAFP